MRSRLLPVLLAALAAATLPTWAADPDPDGDGDGLADYQEIHKYRTDPTKRDTAGTGVADGDGAQRREFTYSVRAVLRVMPPYNLAAMTDDYQDARVLAVTRDYAEVEIVAYPLNTNAAAVRGNPNWARDYVGMTDHLKPGVTTNWDAGMRADLLAEVAAAGIHPDRLTDKETVERVSEWLYRRSEYRYMFGTHFVEFPGGKPVVRPGLERAFEREKGDKGWTTDEQFAHELFGKEMFRRRTHGTCTSAAVLQATVLRALGVPTRFVIAVPVADPSDPDQVARAEKGLTHHAVRTTALYGLLAAGQGYTAHTFLEVYVGHRWRRLNYSALGQNTLDPDYLGLMVHVHTFDELSEANLAATWGTRYALGRRDGVFRHANPYRLMEVADHFGRHAAVPNPPAEKEHRAVTVSKAYWADDKEAPDLVRKAETNAPAGAGRLFLHTDEWFEGAGDYLQYKLFLRRADPAFVLRAEDQPDVKAGLSSAFTTWASREIREFELMIEPAEFGKLAKGVRYTLHPANGRSGYKWVVKDGVAVVRSR